MCHLRTVGQRRGPGCLDSNPSRLDIMATPLFRQLTTRYTTAMDTKTPKPEMPEETNWMPDSRRCRSVPLDLSIRLRIWGVGGSNPSGRASMFNDLAGVKP